MKKLTFIYITSIALLLWLSNSERSGNYHKKNVPDYIKLKRTELYYQVGSKDQVAALVSYVAGELKYLNPKDKQAHRTLNLYHLFTPSGIHFSAMYIFLYPLVLLFRKRKWLQNSLSSSLCLIPFFLDGLYSMKRVALYRLFSLSFKVARLKDKISPFSLFLITFLIDFFIGTYRYSPLSFAYSFLFLGIIFSFIHKNKLLLPIALLGGQIIIAYFQEISLPFLGFIFGFILTSLFSLFFPLWFIYFFLPWIVPAKIISISLGLYLNLVSFSANLAKSIGEFNITIPLMILVVVLTMKIDQRIKKSIFLFTLLISSNLLFAPMEATKKKFYGSYANKTYSRPAKF
ncbi:MAG: hypothetical protein A2504_06015 [Bdellovibrionales bacterium RIFOXYD12_FULL_39_22]|nr:MAG: hypothetical protein A2385_08335 [Bdellovibrionales bacterium RIFOXYB1_FULL_39_21]OFZ45288.1 MAG: hypothetical protein A2485_06200 [Bdellovibrionales bacterium RIFOXYC12_FULL_39_17]OFZ45522.1 MAG: hypothetical protein A2404_02915 [Bdellovibrionales bacterium RIFOXYC1_FULL_39_130]OFZ77383.1 MAG: hypothetical protein A2560_08505 [Bdellovibrionales bacterium RIFOXYD1_FULL_39_84]OFZ91512.1 MAG: hypothetical protein A2504_06015 [Bdellovibrionales bacterium RIFOXYD12_FULL_39_22]HLE12032.1 hy